MVIWGQVLFFAFIWISEARLCFLSCACMSKGKKQDLTPKFDPKIGADSLVGI